MVRLVCGIRRSDGAPADRRLIEAMLAAMNPGELPAARDVFVEGPVGLGLIEIAPPQAAEPPAPRILSGPAGVLAADIRLHDRDGLDGLSEAAAEDAALLAAARQAWGWKAPARLHGDFAYAFLDRGTGALELGRDHFGVRPLQYTHRRGSYVAFASLPAALLRTGLADRVLDVEALRYCHYDFYAPRERTYYEQIQCAQPAHVTRFLPGRTAQPMRYWRLPIPKRVPFDSDFDALAAELLRLLDQAVRRRLPPDGPVAGELSGGLDSTSIAVLAARVLRTRGRTYYGFSHQEARNGADLPIIDEAADVAATAALEPNIEVVPATSRGLYEIICAGHDIDSFLPLAEHEPTNFALRRAAEVGSPVMFSGWGGDEITTHIGRGAYAELFWTGHWALLHRALRARSAWLGGTVRSRLFWQVAVPSVPMGVRHRILRMLGKADGFARMHGSALPYLPRHRRGPVPRAPFPDGPDCRRNRRGYAENWFMPKRLERHAQQAARFGMSYVFPMLDRDLVDFAMRLPGIFSCWLPGDRSLIRAAARDVLPDRVRLRREKLMPFALEALRLAEGQPEMIERVRGIESSALANELVDVPAVRRRLEELPDAETVRAETVAAAERGEQFSNEDFACQNALTLAMILAEHENALALPEGTRGLHA